MNRCFRRSSGCRRDSNPHLLGASQGSYPLDDGPKISMLREGFEPSSSAFGGPRSSDRAVATQSCSVTQAGFEPASTVSETVASAGLGYWAVALHQCTRQASNLHAAG